MHWIPSNTYIHYSKLSLLNTPIPILFPPPPYNLNVFLKNNSFKRSRTPTKGKFKWTHHLCYHTLYVMDKLCIVPPYITYPIFPSKQDYSVSLGLMPSTPSMKLVIVDVYFCQQSASQQSIILLKGFEYPIC